MDYSTCRRRIALTLSPTEIEYVEPAAAISRVTASSQLARVPQPEYSQSLRDGYALGSYAVESAPHRFPITGLIAAGSEDTLELEANHACRIMTGGKIPPGAVQVIPQEDCTEDNGFVTVLPEALARNHTFIQHQGSELTAGTEVVPAGAILSPQHVCLLASAGCEKIAVHRRPQIGYFCSGTELVDSASSLRPGLKISSNRFLLAGCIEQCGGIPHYLGTVGDSEDELASAFTHLKAGTHDLIISTGGMGPGKYDLIENCFRRAGGEVIYNRLNLRPGKDSLFGRLNSTLFFGLPGPPTAVRALMNCFVGPTILAMQGCTRTFPNVLQAHLEHPMSLKRPGVMQLRSGILSSDNGRCTVRLAERHEVSTCYLIISAERSSYNAGDLVDTHQLLSPFPAL